MHEVVLVELIMEPDGEGPFVCAQEGVFPDESSARAWVVSTWPFHKDHGHVIEINPQKDDCAGASIFASFVTLPFGRGISGAKETPDA